MARASMAAIIAEIREMIGTTSLSDDAIERVLDKDQNRCDVTFVALVSETTISSSGEAEMKRFVFPETITGTWEAAPQLQNATGADLRAWLASENLNKGLWIFSSDQFGGVFLSGSIYDLNGAAADLLIRLAANDANEYDFTVENKTFKRSQKSAAKRALIEEYQSKRWQAPTYLPSAGVC